MKPLSTLRCIGAALCVATMALAGHVMAATPQELLAGYAAEAGAAPAPARGQRFFTQRHGRDWSCSSCHGASPTTPGQHQATGKTIAPLAPAYNGQRFTDAAKTEKWFGRNCNDVTGRACSTGEKADVLVWLLSLQP